MLLHTTLQLMLLVHGTGDVLDAEVHLQAPSAAVASERLLGHNLEAGLDTVPGLLSDRLDNPKFLGPADPVTGIAPGWRHYSDNMNGIMCQLLPGAGMGSGNAQYIRSFTPGLSFGILQNARQVRAGEEFDVEIWARTWIEPVTLEVGILPLPSRQPPYSQATIEVRAPYYKRYTTKLTVPVDDDEAAFYCAIQGEGSVWVDQIHMRPAGEGPVSRAVMDAFSSLEIPVLRFPGGVQSTVYRWRHGTGPVELRPVTHDPSCKYTPMNYDFGVDEYLDLCRSQGITPHITVNIGFGTPDEAAEWAGYCADWGREEGLDAPTAYFQVGNHPYLAAELAHMTPAMYVETLRAFVPGIRERFPDARIIAVSDPLNDDWLTAVLDEAPGLFDVIAIQGYAGQPMQLSGMGHYADTPEDEAARMASVLDGADDLCRVLRGAIDEIHARELRCGVGLVEWNLWGQASHRDGRNFHEPMGVQHGLFAAAMLHQFVGLAPDLELANFYHLLNPMGLFLHRGPDVTAATVVDVFKLYRPAFPGQRVQLDAVSPTLGAHEVIDAAALKNAAGLWLFIVNRHPDHPVSVRITGAPEKSPESAGLTGDGMVGDFAITQPEFAGGRLRLEPLSITRLRFAE